MAEISKTINDEKVTIDASRSFFESFLNFKSKLNLPNPGSLEHLHKDAKSVTNVNHFFEGGKADLAKGLSPNFQVSHSFMLNSGTNSPGSAYHFGALYATEHHLLHGIIGGDGALQGKYHFNPSKESSFRLHHQITPGQPAYDMVQIEMDHLGKDFSINAKAFNPSPLQGGTGIFTGGFLHSISSKVALGAECIFQRINPKEQDLGLSLLGKMWDEKRIFSFTLQQLTLLQASYWYKVSEKVELGSEIQASLIGRRDGVATVACKLEYKQATVRGQADTTGKVGLVLEEKLAPGFSFVVCGELDHLKGSSRFGVGINMES